MIRIFTLFVTIFVSVLGFSQNLDEIYPNFKYSDGNKSGLEEPLKIDFSYLKRNNSLLSSKFSNKDLIINWDSLQNNYELKFKDSIWVTDDRFITIPLLNSEEARLIASISRTILLKKSISQRKRKKLIKKFRNKRKRTIIGYSFPLRINENYVITKSSSRSSFSYDFYSLFFWDKLENKWRLIFEFNHSKE